MIHNIMIIGVSTVFTVVVLIGGALLITLHENKQQEF